MSISYSQNSPYYTTVVYNNLFLDVMNNRDIIPDPTDVYWQITQTYNMRPDMLAYDLYGNSQLWWVFAQRNPNMIKDPLFDFVAGTYIFLPQLDNLKTQLSL
jgi:prophage DNA circulation protein